MLLDGGSLRLRGLRLRLLSLRLRLLSLGLRLHELADDGAQAMNGKEQLEVELCASLRRGVVVLEPLCDGLALIGEAILLPHGRIGYERMRMRAKAVCGSGPPWPRGRS